MKRKTSVTKENTESVGFVNKDGVLYAGIHLLVDIWGSKHLDSVQEIEKALTQCALDSGATILHSHMHKFAPHGVSGVIVLSESHISIHTWPEREYAALDIFVCGNCNPYNGIKALKEYFKPEIINIVESKRGIQV